MSIREPIVLVLQENQAGGGSPGTTQQAPDTAAGLEPMEQGGEGQAGPQSLFSSLMPLLVIGLIFYVLLIGPERKNRKKQEVMRKDLKKGDEVMTTGGLFGRVTATDEEKVTLQIADGVRVKFLRQAIQGRVGEELEDGKIEPEKS